MRDERETEYKVPYPKPNLTCFCLFTVWTKEMVRACLFELTSEVRNVSAYRRVTCVVKRRTKDKDGPVCVRCAALCRAETSPLPLPPPALLFVLSYSPLENRVRM